MSQSPDRHSTRWSRQHQGISVPTLPAGKRWRAPRFAARWTASAGMSRSSQAQLMPMAKLFLRRLHRVDGQTAPVEAQNACLGGRNRLSQANALVNPTSARATAQQRAIFGVPFARKTKVFIEMKIPPLSPVYAGKGGLSTKRLTERTKRRGPPD